MGVIHRRAGTPGQYRWEGVTIERYEGAHAAAVTKQVVIGPREGAERFVIRYFEIAPGGASALDVHHHDHGVMVLRGEGVVRLGEERHPIRAGDVVYVGPDELHQFENPGAEPLGFLCVVPPR